MNTFNFAMLIWGSLAVLFLVTTFFIGKKYLFILLLNVLFLTISYVGISQFLGEPKPINANIPLYDHGEWTEDGVPLLTMTYDDSNIWILVNEGKPRLYVMPYNAEFVAAIKKQLMGAKGDWSLMKLHDPRRKGTKAVPNHTLYEGDSSSHVSIEVPPSEEYIPKQAPNNGGINEYEAQ